MKCLVCGGHQRHAFRAVVPMVGAIAYYRCNDCGFTSAPIYSDMSDAEFAGLNARIHAYQATGDNDGDPRWRQRLHAQAAVIHTLVGRGVIDDERPSGAPAPWLDHACGDGYLAELLNCHRYDPMTQPVVPATKFGMVVSTSAFEHFRFRDDFESCREFLRDDGILALHTLVCERIPDDPHWFYLHPGHCSLFTNAAMQKLFEQWGFASSLYAIDARMWFWFKWFHRGALPIVRRSVYQDKFVDYWRAPT